MAAAAASMDFSSSDHRSEVSSRLKGGGGGALAVNKSSVKIGKSMKKVATTPSRPAAKVYNTDPSDFRRVVQELTGTSPASATAAEELHPPAVPPPPPAPRAASRLQRFAPPPLRPTLHNNNSALFQQQHSHRSPIQQPLHSTHPAAFAQMPHNGHLPALSPHLFSPLPALTPGDNTWASLLETPGALATAVTHRNATSSVPQHMNTEGEGPGRTDTAFAHQAPPLFPSPAARFPWSPGLMPWSPRFLPSPMPLSPNFLPPLSPSILPPLSPGFFTPSGLSSSRSGGFGLDNIYNGEGLNGTRGTGLSQGFTFQGQNGFLAYRPS